VAWSVLLPPSQPTDRIRRHSPMQWREGGGKRWPTSSSARSAERRHRSSRIAAGHRWRRPDVAARGPPRPL